MDKKEARFILGLHRGGEADSSDPQFIEAQKKAKAEPDLARWWERERELDEIVSAKLTSVPVPPGLKERILSETPLRDTLMRRRWLRPVLLAAACLIALAIFFGSWRGPFQPAISLADYRDGMVHFIDGPHPLDLESGDLSLIQQSLEKSRALGPFEIPKQLRELEPVGCRMLQFRGQVVALICFRHENGKYAHLFVMKSTALAHLPDRGKPNYSPRGRWMTAAWAYRDMAYLLLVEGDRAQIEKVFESS